MGRNSNRFGKVEEYSNQTFNFSIGRNDFEISVDYAIRTTGEHPSWDYPGDSESEIIDLEINEVTIWNDDLDEWVAIDENEEVVDSLLIEIQKYHQL